MPSEVTVLLPDGSQRSVPDGTTIAELAAGIGRRVAHLQELVDEHEVAERLRHLLASKAHHAHVHPVAHKARARRRLRLRGLALVVREDEVVPATVKIDRRAELSQG